MTQTGLVIKESRFFLHGVFPLSQARADELQHLHSMSIQVVPVTWFARLPSHQGRGCIPGWASRPSHLHRKAPARNLCFWKRV